MKSSVNQAFEYDVRFITRKWAPAMGGMETYCQRLTEELAGEEHLDIIMLPGQTGGAAPTALQLVRFGMKTAGRLLFSSKARVVHIGDVASWPLGWIASMRHPESRIVISAHGSDLSFAQRGGLLSALYGLYVHLGARCLKNCVLIANSNWIAKLASRYGFDNTRVVLLGTDVKPVGETLEGSGEHNGQLFFAGRILKSKGLSNFVKTVLPKISNPPRVRVAGTVWDEAEAQILKSPHVEYLGVLGEEALAREYAEALCVIVPSLGPEGFGLVAVEAVAAGGVVICSDHSGLKEACKGPTSFLSDPNRPEDWVQAFEKVRGWTPSQRRVLIGQAVASETERFSWSRVARETREVYRAESGGELLAAGSIDPPTK